MPAKIEIHNTLVPAKKVYAYLDFDDFFIARYHRWYYYSNSSTSYPIAHIEERSFDTKMTSSRKSLGNFIMKPSDGYEVSYLDGNPFNCSRENLIVVPRASTARSKRKCYNTS